MASDNGDLEIQEDSLDAAIKTHRRAMAPEGLRDRCLSTVAPANRGVEPLPVEAMQASPKPIRAEFSPLVRWALAASILITAVGTYFFYDYRTRHSLALRRTVAAATGFS